MINSYAKDSHEVPTKAVLDSIRYGEPYDSANAHNGFVSVADVAFQDLAAPARQTNLNVIAWHASSKP